jgi:hypothetical protein
LENFGIQEGQIVGPEEPLVVAFRFALHELRTAKPRISSVQMQRLLPIDLQSDAAARTNMSVKWWTF